MLISIDQVLTKEEVRQFRAELDAAHWDDGAATAGTLSKAVKHNQQIDDRSELCQRLGQQILRRLGATPLFISAALPRTIYPPKFNRYAGGGTYGAHVDSALMYLPGSNQQMRTDLSCTLFLAEPEHYDGGELVIADTFGEQRIKLAAGDAVVYPGTSVHRVEPVTRGARLASFFWIESMVRSDEQRRLLHDMDRALMRLRSRDGESDEAVALTGTYHNLLRLWADT